MATTEDLADDAMAAMRTLRARPEVDATRIGLVGHSEGALVAAVAAARPKSCPGARVRRRRRSRTSCSTMTR
jgi:dienelactone hydrolase